MLALQLVNIIQVYKHMCIYTAGWVKKKTNILFSDSVIKFIGKEFVAWK